MKKLLQTIAFVFAAGSLFAQAIPNGGFENWTNYSWMDPTGYMASNDQYVPNGLAANAVRVGSAYHGSYAVQLTTTKVGNDTLQAYFIDGQPNGSNFYGGIPYNQKPTGMRIYYKCNIMPGDTGFFLVIFKKSGIPIAEYEYKIHGIVASYTLFAQTFSPAIPTTPDTVMFGATPSNLLSNNNFKGIPGSTLTVDSLTFTGGVSQPAALNGDFENWTTDSVLIPTGWSVGLPGVMRTTDKYQGSFAMEMQTQGPTPHNNQPQPGNATTGMYTNNGIVGGYPYTQQLDTLTFYYKYAPVGTDTASVNLEFKKGGSPIFYTGKQITGAAAVYTLDKVGFNVGATPDTVIVSFQSSNWNSNTGAHIGSDFKVDNVQFMSSPLTVVMFNTYGSIKVYPNPSTGLFNIDTRSIRGSIENINVYDITGKLINATNYSGSKNNLVTLDMSNCASGVYMIHVTTTEGSYYQKINKE